MPTDSPLKALRLSRNLSVSQLAMMVGRSRVAVYGWEIGANRPTRSNLLAVFDALEATEDERAAILRWVSLPLQPVAG
jgi:transcriptional regulator with XRE-family HTH domain